MFGLVVGWCCSWARLAEGIVGIVSFGKFTPHWGLAVCGFFNNLRVKKLQQEGLLVEAEWNFTSQVECPNCGGTKFQMGPRGGLAQNIRCVCGYELNVTRFPDGRFLVEDITNRHSTKVNHG